MSSNNSNLTHDEILNIRRKSVNPCMSIAYDKPLKIVRGEGVWLYDEQDNAYLDMVNNVSHVGHCHPKVFEAASEQMQLLNTNSRYLHDKLALYSEQLLATFPKELSVVFFCCTGSEANELALRLARAKTGGDQWIAVDGAYHGNTQNLIDLSSYKHNAKGGEGAPDHVHIIPTPDNYNGLIKDSDNAGFEYAEFIETVLENMDKGQKQVSAFICESLQGCGGQMPLPEGYLSEVYQRVRSAGGVCIADEVQVGFGRSGTHMWAFEQQNVVPDIVTLGKPIGNGHPMSAVVTTREIADAFNTGMEYFNTFAANPVSCAIGLSVLNIIEEEQLQKNALVMGKEIQNRLIQLQAQSPYIGDVRGTGLFIGAEFVTDKASRTPDPKRLDKVIQAMQHRGILLSSEGPNHNVLKIKPPMVFNSVHLDYFVTNLTEVLQQQGCLE